MEYELLVHFKQALFEVRYLSIITKDCNLWKQSFIPGGDERFVSS